jgi:5-hydroxyisourate hydrolase
VLDTQLGRPARGVPVRLYRVEDGLATPCGAGETDADGRIGDLLQGPLELGLYRIEFDVAEYARKQGQASPFFALFASDIRVDNTARSYHVPLLLSPHSAMTYLGS